MDYLISEDCQSLVEIQGFLEKPGKVLALGSRADLFGALSNEALPEYVKAQFEWDKYAKTVKLNIFENTAARLSQSRPQRNCVANVIPKRP